MQPDAILEHFRTQEPWFADPLVDAAILSSGPYPAPAAAFQARFPQLSALLTRSLQVRIRAGAGPMDLLVWDSAWGPMAWLCDLPAPADDLPVCADHALLLTGFGGIRERFNERLKTWWLNHGHILTREIAAFSGAFLHDYAWAFPEERVPIDTERYYWIAREVNGNITLCERATGAVILFASDHSHTHITPLPGLPPRTLHTVRNAPVFCDWVEANAAQWLAGVTPLP